MRVWLVLAVAFSLAHPLAHAQRSTMSNGNGGANFVGMDSVGDPSKDMMRRFIDASRLALTGSQQLLAALGQDQDAAAMGERAAQLSETMTRRAVEETLEAQLRGAAVSAKSLAGGGQAPAAQLEAALAALAQAVAQYDLMLKDLPEARTAMNTIRMVSKTDTPAFYMLRSLPGNTASLKKEIRTIAQASRQAGATVPEALLAI